MQNQCCQSEINPFFWKLGAKIYPCGIPDKTGEYFTCKQDIFAIRNQIAVRYISVQKVSAGVNLPYRASRRKGNESPQTIQTSRPCKFSGGGEREGGGASLRFTQQKKITFNQLGLRPDHKT